MIRLIFVDVDGTLVGSSGDVHPAVWRAAERERDAGIRLAICSGRPALGIARDLAARLDGDGWHVFQNGASVLHPASGRSRSSHLPLETVEMLVARSRRTGRVLELYTDADYAVERDTPRARAHAALLGVPYAPRPFGALDGRVVRGQWLLAYDEAAAVIAEPHPGLVVSPSTSPVMPDTRFVNLTREGVDKATAVRTVAGEYGVPLAQAMFVGDGANDASAMRLVGVPVAMANAESEARAVARHTVGHVDAGGLAEAIDAAVAGCFASGASEPEATG